MAVTPHQMDAISSQIQDSYQQLEMDILKMFIERLKKKGVTQDGVFKWQIERMQELRMINAETIKKASEIAKISKNQLKQMVLANGGVIADDMKSQLDNMGLSASGKNNLDNVLSSLYQEAYQNMNSYVNAGMMADDINRNVATQAYRNVVNSTLNRVASGLQTFDEAMSSAMYELADNGLNSSFISKSGRRWSQDVYMRQLLSTTAHRTFNDARAEVMKDYNIELMSMSDHVASRESCAQVQGRVVDMTPDHKHPDYPNVYDYGYREPAGVDGINCRHVFFPFIEGVNYVDEPKYTPEEATRNGKIQQIQRANEREIRQSKRKLELAQKMGDKKGIAKYRARIQLFQAKQRDLINKHSFLSRDYLREKSYGIAPLATAKRAVKTTSKAKNVVSLNKKVEKAINATNFRDEFGDENANKFIDFVKKMPDDNPVKKMTAKYISKVKYVKSDSRNYNSGGTVHLSQKAFDGDDISYPLGTIFHENGHAYDGFKLIEEYGNAIETEQIGTQKVKIFAGKMADAPVYARKLSSLPKYDLKKTLEKDLWNAVNGDLPTIESLGKKPRRNKNGGKDLKEYMQKYTKIYDTSRNNYYHEFIKKYDAGKDLIKTANLSDILQANQNAVYYDNDAAPYGVGHGSKYFDKFGQQADTEFFAEMSEMVAVNNPELETIKKIFPNAVKIWEDMAK